MKMTEKRYLVTLLLSLFILTTDANANKPTTEGRASGIQSGNTFTLLVNKQQYAIQIYGIHIPSQVQLSSKKTLWRIIAGKQLQLTIFRQKRNGAILAVVYLYQQDVAENMIRSGLAIPIENIKDEFKHYYQAASYAQKNHLGIWQK